MEYDSMEYDSMEYDNKPIGKKFETKTDCLYKKNFFDGIESKINDYYSLTREERDKIVGKEKIDNKKLLGGFSDSKLKLVNNFDLGRNGSLQIYNYKP